MYILQYVSEIPPALNSPIFNQFTYLPTYPSKSIPIDSFDPNSTTSRTEAKHRRNNAFPRPDQGAQRSPDLPIRRYWSGCEHVVLRKPSFFCLLLSLSPPYQRTYKLNTKY